MPARRSVLLALPSFLIAASAVAAPSAPAPTEGTISVAGDATVRTSPDQVIIRVAVESNGTDLPKILAETDTRTSRVRTVAREAGVSPEHIQTESITLQQRYENARPSGYTAQRSVVVCMKNLAGVNDLLTKLVGAGVTRIDSLSFETSALRTHRDEARAQAVRAARQKAELLAKELGVKVGQPLSIVEGGAGQRGGSFGGYQSFAPDPSAEESSGGFAPGQIAVTAQVSVVFAIE